MYFSDQFDFKKEGPNVNHTYEGFGHAFGPGDIVISKKSLIEKLQTDGKI